MDQYVTNDRDVLAKDAPLESGIKFKVAKHDARPVIRQHPAAPLNKKDVLKSVWNPADDNRNFWVSIHIHYLQR